MSRPEALAVGKACCARLYSYSRLKKREPLIALGSNQGGFLISASAVPHCGANAKDEEDSVVIEQNVIDIQIHNGFFVFNKIITMTILLAC